MHRWVSRVGCLQGDWTGSRSPHEAGGILHCLTSLRGKWKSHIPGGKQEKEERNLRLLPQTLLSKTPVLSPSPPKPPLISPSLSHPYICFMYSELSKTAIFLLSFSLPITHLEPSLQILSFPHRAQCLEPTLAVTTTRLRAVQSLCHFPIMWWRVPLLKEVSEHPSVHTSLHLDLLANHFNETWWSGRREMATVPLIL